MNKEITEKLKAHLRKVLDLAMRNYCLHEETHRGGTIWEICDSCGAKWADDEGGMPAKAREYPEVYSEAFDYLISLEEQTKIKFSGEFPEEWEVTTKDLKIGEKITIPTLFGEVVFEVIRFEEKSGLRVILQASPNLETILNWKNGGWYSRGITYNPNSIIKVKLEN
jgi:hypothetical protein